MSHQVWLIAQRSIVRTFRQPGTWIPPLTFPLLLMAVNSNGLRAATHLPGFPTHSFLAFFLPFSFLQGALFASGIAGTDLARDIDTGFLNRLALTPIRGAERLRRIAAHRAFLLNAPDPAGLQHRRHERPACLSAPGRRLRPGGRRPGRLRHLAPLHDLRPLAGADGGR